MALKQHLTSTVTELKHIDWHLGQLDQIGEDAVRITPSCYLRFTPLEWMHLKGPRNVQRAVMELEVHLVSNTAYGDGRDMTDTTYIDHLAIESKVYVALQNKRFMLSDAPGYEELADTAADRVLIESMVRTMTEPHDTLSNLIVTTLIFQANIFDYSAEPETLAAQAALGLDVIIVQDVNAPDPAPEPEEEEEEEDPE
jgi:hypothetical protein